LVSAVVGAHCVAVGSAFLFQGCGTTRGPVAMPNEAPMPPSLAAEPAEVVRAAPIPVAPVAPGGKSWAVDATTTYVVGKGDTLSQIGYRYGVSVAELMTLNNIADPGKIRIGQKLVLPGKIDINKPVKRPAAPTANHAKKPAIPAGSNGYVVQAGDCLSVIAAKAGVTTKALQEANGLKSDAINVGQTLILPAGMPIAAAPAPLPRPAAPVAPAEIVARELPDVSDEELPMVDLAPELPVPAGSVTMYKVQAGDDILTVASQHNVSIADLRRVNRLTSDILVAGQRLVIPTQD